MLQFGVPEFGLNYVPRPAAFGIADRDGLIALVRVRPLAGGDWLDLPGGALEARETEAEALVREFGEETGLKIEVDQEVVRIAQYFRKNDGQPVDNQGGVYGVSLVADAPELKIEADHELVWIAPEEAVKHLRHDGHAWAVAAWLRRR